MMTCFDRSIGLSFVLAVWLTAPTLGQTGASNLDEPPTTRLVIHPAEPPAIAMQHRLLPRYLDLVPGNAAVQYLKIFPEGGDTVLKKHNVRVSELLDQKAEEFSLEEAKKILGEVGPAPFDYLQLASVREDCDWDVPVRERELYFILLPEVQDLRTLARYLALRTRVQIGDGQLEEAIKTLRLGYVLSRNAAKGPTLIHGLVGAAIARLMNDRLRELIERPGTPNLYWSIAALPDPFVDVRQAMDVEAGAVYLMFPQLKDVATTRLTDEQWSLRLTDFGQSLSKFESIVGPDEAKRWQDKLALGLKIAAVTAFYYPRAKADLATYGWSQERLDTMSPAQVILLHIGQTYEVMSQSMFKWFHVPYWQSQDALSKAQQQFANTAKNREILPLASMLVPAVNAARFAVVRLDREFAALRTVEALRLYAATHDGKLPATLEDIKEVPVPLDPVMGRLFDYKLDGPTATLEGKAPAGQSIETGAFRYLITVAKKGAAPASLDRPAEKQRDESPDDQGAGRVEAAASSIGEGLIEFFTTNPILEIGESRRRAKSLDNLKHIGLAMHNYHDIYKHFPPAATVDKDGKKLLSWRVHVLPYVEQGELYRQFKLDEPWDSEHNKKLIEKMPDVFHVPALPRLPKYTTTYLVPVGEETIFHDNKGTPLKEIRDGTAKTIMIVEADADQAVIWTKPGDWQFDPKEPARGLGKLRGTGFLAAFADASVRTVSIEKNKDVLPRFFMRADGLPLRIE
jgi:hypothetical protein